MSAAPADLRVVFETPLHEDPEWAAAYARVIGPSRSDPIVAMIGAAAERSFLLPPGRVDVRRRVYDADGVVEYYAGTPGRGPWLVVACIFGETPSRVRGGYAWAERANAGVQCKAIEANGIEFAPSRDVLGEDAIRAAADDAARLADECWTPTHAER